MTATLLLATVAHAGPVVTDQIGGSATSDRQDWSYKTDVIEVTNTARLISIAPRIFYDPQSGNGADALYFVLYEESAPDEWDLVWDSGLQSVGTANEFKESPLVDVVLDAGTRYLVGWYMPDGNYTFYWQSPGPAVTTSWCTFEGSVWTAENTTYALPQTITGNPVDDNGYMIELTAEVIDVDGDGVLEDTDCDDEEPLVFPGAPELCDGIDNDCSGKPDDPAIEVLWFEDFDLDGYGDPAAVHDLCDGSMPDAGWVDNDLDCNDANGNISPDASEVCDGLDNDCDGLLDDDDDSTDPNTFATYYADVDRDGYGDPDAPLDACEAPSGFVVDATDCDDTSIVRFPGNTEICDGVDNDCDEIADGEADGDGDGFLDCEDCDPADATTYPGAEELCDGVDHDCDGVGPTELECDADKDEDIVTRTCGCSAAGTAGWPALLLLPLLFRGRASAGAGSPRR